MKVDLSTFETWEHLNSAVAAELKVPSDITVRCYPGLPAAIFEMVQSTAQFYSHKRSIALVSGQTPHLQSILPYLYKEGYEVQIQPDGVPVSEWLSGLKKDTCFAVFCEDHPVTAQLYPVDEIENFLNEKKIFSFRISHHNHLFRSVDLLPYSARICSFDPQTAVVMMGVRQKAAPLLAPFLAWNKIQFLQTVQKVRDRSWENQSAIESFESHLPSGFQPLFESGVARCFDRALIFSDLAGGQALQSRLAAFLNHTLQGPSWETHIETTHLCRWGGVKSYDLWWKSRPSEDVLRGLLILSVELLKVPELRLSLQGALKKAFQECQLVQFN